MREGEDPNITESSRRFFEVNFVRIIPISDINSKAATLGLI